MYVTVFHSENCRYLKRAFSKIRLCPCIKLSSVSLQPPHLSMAQTHLSTTDKGKQRQPPVVHPASGNSIIINPCQRLNPIVECIRNVPKEFGDILPDYQVGRTTGVLFLRFLLFFSIPLATDSLTFLGSQSEIPSSPPRVHSPAHRASGSFLQPPRSSPHV